MPSQTKQKPQRKLDERRKKIVTLATQQKTLAEIAELISLSKTQTRRIVLELIQSGHLKNYKKIKAQRVKEISELKPESPRPLGYCEKCNAVVEQPCVKCNADLFKTHVTSRKNVYTTKPYSLPITVLKPFDATLEKLSLVGIKQIGHLLEETVDSLVDHVSLHCYEVARLLKALQLYGLNTNGPLKKLELKKVEVHQRAKQQYQLTKKLKQQKAKVHDKS